MRVFLPRLNLDPFVDIPVGEFERLAARDRFREHQLADDAENADLILFSQCHMVDWRLKSIRDHPVTQRYREKVIVYDERDRPWCAIPGVYVSMPAPQFDDRFQRAWGYFRHPEIPRFSIEPDLLFSFIGSPSASCRKPLFKLNHHDGIVEAVHRFTFYDPASLDYERRLRRYRELLSRSRFVLCPRGKGTSSFRLYETLAAGRVPVIISDDWLPPRGLDWSRFSIRWPEKRPEGIITMLQERDSDWRAMAAAASDAYREFFAPEAAFHRIVTLCAELYEEEATRSFPRNGQRNRAFVAAGMSVAHGRVLPPTRRLVRRLLQHVRIM